jgi:ATP-binding cassette, subfamily B, multidrug efflux pump
VFRFFEGLTNPYPAESMGTPPKRFFAFLWLCTKGVRPWLLGMTLCTAVVGSFEALLFSMMASVLDWLSSTPPQQFWAQHGPVLLGLGGVLMLSVALVMLQALFKFQALQCNFPMRLRWSFHKLMLEQSLSFYQDEFAGRIATKLVQTALAVRDAWMVFADILVYVLIYFVTMVGIVGSFNAWLILPFSAWFALYLGALIYFVPRLSKISKVQADARSLMTGRITDAYTNITTVKLFSHSQREAQFARGAMQEFMGTAYIQMRLVSVFEITNQILSVLLIAGTAGISLWLWTLGHISVGAVAAATAMALRLNGISHWVMWELAALFEHIGTVQDGIQTLSRPQTIVDAPEAPALKVVRGEIRFDKVHFAYNPGRVVVDGLNLHIQPGEKIGLVGRSGAGKSTLVNLLLRFYEVNAGQILIDGQNIAGISQNSLRQQIGMVTQDTSLLHRSVRDNIVYGRPDASEAELMEAAKRAQAHDFIQTLSDAKNRHAYEAHVGERGVKLSGGQRQRIAIARVMLKDAPILLLDEATSALDSEVEAVIQESLYELMQGKTVVAIAHRLSTIAAMDRLIVMDQGHIVEQGDHASLLAQGGIYARLWAHQSGGFLGEEAPQD